MRQPVKLLIVDDSSFMRRVLTSSLEADRNFVVVGEAFDGCDALKKIKKLKPDVVTLDVEMPGMSGLDTLRKIMTSCPVPVVMLSAHTTRGAEATIRALACGAVDFVAKPKHLKEFTSMVETLKLKLKVAARLSHFAGANRHVDLRQRINLRYEAGTSGPEVKSGRAGSNTIADTSALSGANGCLGVSDRTDLSRCRIGRNEPADSSGCAGAQRIVVIGCSTGGPAALHKVVPCLPGKLPAPVVIVQHIPVGFSASLAEHLAQKSALEVRHAENGDELRSGRVLVAPAGFSFQFKRKGSGVYVELKKGKASPGGFCPSVDDVMTSAAKVYGSGVIAVLLTGMGKDGVRGMMEIKKRGGTTLAEHESTCVVYGMPKAAYDAGVVDRMLPIDQIAAVICKML